MLSGRTRPQCSQRSMSRKRALCSRGAEKMGEDRRGCKDLMDILKQGEATTYV